MGREKRLKRIPRTPVLVVFSTLSLNLLLSSLSYAQSVPVVSAEPSAVRNTAPAPNCRGQAPHTTSGGRSYCGRDLTNLAELLSGADANFRAQSADDDGHAKFFNPYFGLSEEASSAPRSFAARPIHTFWETPSSQITYRTLNSANPRDAELKRNNCTEVAASIPLFLMTHRVTAVNTTSCPAGSTCPSTFRLTFKPRTDMSQLSTPLGATNAQRASRQRLLAGQTEALGGSDVIRNRDDLRMFWSTIEQSLSSVSAWVYHPESARERTHPTRLGGASLMAQAKDDSEQPEDPHFASANDENKVHRQFGNIHFSIPAVAPAHADHPEPLDFDIAQCERNGTPNRRTCEFDFKVRSCGLMGDALRLARSFEDFYLFRRAYLPAVWDRSSVPAPEQASGPSGPASARLPETSAEVPVTPVDAFGAQAT